MKLFLCILLALSTSAYGETIGGRTCDLKRDARGHIARSRAVLAAFKRLHPCPATGKSRGACPGWTIDHITPLACCGGDVISNLQWMTTAAAKEKDRWERKECGRAD